jgi:hypothetical protein
MNKLAAAITSPATTATKQENSMMSLRSIRIRASPLTSFWHPKSMAVSIPGLKNHENWQGVPIPPGPGRSALNQHGLARIAHRLRAVLAGSPVVKREPARPLLLSHHTLGQGSRPWASDTPLGTPPAALSLFVGNPTHGRALGGRRGTREEEMWLALAAITLAAAIGFNVLALAIQFER